MIITINNVNFNLDVDKAILSGALERYAPHKVGNKYKWINDCGPTRYILASTGSSGKAVLINLSNGVSLCGCHTVGLYDAITEIEFNEIAGGKGTLLIRVDDEQPLQSHHPTA